MPEKRSIVNNSNNKKTQNHSISTTRIAYAAATMVSGIPILLILSAISISSVFTAQLVYSQGPSTRQQQQQDLND